MADAIGVWLNGGEEVIFSLLRGNMGQDEKLGLDQAIAKEFGQYETPLYRTVMDVWIMNFPQAFENRMWSYWQYCHATISRSREILQLAPP